MNKEEIEQYADSIRRQREKDCKKERKKKEEEIWKKELEYLRRHFNQDYYNRENIRDEYKSIPYNTFFPNSESHHVDMNHIIFIPKELHHSIPHNLKTGYNMYKINALAFKFLFSL